MACGIYKIENKVNGKVYIGQSINIIKRWTNHRATFNKGTDLDKILYRAITKYGMENFNFTIVEECEPSKLNDREIFWITKYNSYENGYNATKGGNNPVATKLSEDNVSEIITLLKQTDVTQRAIAENFDVCEKTISLINLGLSRRQDGIEYPIRAQKHQVWQCQFCGSPITKGYSQCRKCAEFASRKAERPDRITLKNLIRTIPFTTIGKQFGVSDNAIRKWCIKEGLPSKRKDINALSEEQWIEI